MNPFKIIKLDTVDSTNNYLKQLAKNGAENYTTIISNVQTAGKGTHSRSFISKEGGIYLSILLHTDINGFDSTLITPMTAVVVSESIAEISGRAPKIKWVNDVYLDNKKVCGILCESVAANSSEKRCIIVGIGVNLFKPNPDFDNEIKDIATCVFDDYDDNIKEKFIKVLLEKFIFYYENFNKKTFLKSYKNDNFILGKKIKYFIDGKEYGAVATAIDDNCRLIVKDSNKRNITLTSCEIIIDN